MAGDSGCATNNTSFSNMNTPRDGHASRNSRMSTNTYIVPNLNLIIYFYAIFNDCVLQRASVYGGIGPDFHVVTNPYSTKLWHPDPYTIIAGDSKTITANYNARMN